MYWLTHRYRGQAPSHILISMDQIDLILALALALAFAFAFAFNPRRPVKPRWPNAGLNPWVTRQDAGLAVLGQGWPMTAAHGFKPAFGHTEPKRGAEWWGKSPLVTLGLFQSDPP